MPCSSACSSRLPAPTQTPSEALCRCGIASVTTTRPEGRRVTSMLMRRLLAAARLAAMMNFSTAPWSAGSTVTRSGRVSRSPSQSGSAGLMPLAASTAAGNFAGCAVDSTTIGTVRSRLSFSATATATAVCGSIR